MTTERDELAQIIDSLYEDEYGLPVVGIFETIADAILAAGYRKVPAALVEVVTAGVDAIEKVARVQALVDDPDTGDMYSDSAIVVDGTVLSRILEGGK